MVRTADHLMRSLILVVMSLSFISCASAADQIIINSRNWQDIYSAMVYAGFQGLPAQYIVEEGQGLLLLEGLDRQLHEIQLIESADDPFIKSFGANLDSKGFAVDVMTADDTLNLDLARDLDAEGYIIMDTLYPYNAISVLPFALRERYYVVFADSENIGDVLGIIPPGSDIMIYGNVDREVSEAFAQFSPEIIDEGDKFSNNIAMAERFLESTSVRQVVLTDGNILEPQFFSAAYPIVFIGKTNLPPQTVAFLKDAGFEHGVLVGYDLFQNGVTIKEQTGVKIMVKFAKGVNQQQYALDIFNLPLPKYDIKITKAVYNILSASLEITYENREQYPAMVRASHNILSDNLYIATVGDDFAFYLAGGEQKTVAYRSQLQADVISSGLSLRSDVVYGADENELEYLSVYNVPISTISVEDSSSIAVGSTVYSKPTRRFNIEVKNTGDEPVYAKPEIHGILINDKKETLTTEPQEIAPGQTAVFRIKASLTDADIADNPKISMVVWYGQRKDAMVGMLEHQAEFGIAYLSSDMKMGIIAAGVIAGIIIMLILVLRKRDRRATPAPKPHSPHMQAHPQPHLMHPQQGHSRNLHPDTHRLAQQHPSHKVHAQNPEQYQHTLNPTSGQQSSPSKQSPSHPPLPPRH